MIRISEISHVYNFMKNNGWRYWCPDCKNCFDENKHNCNKTKEVEK